MQWLLNFHARTLVASRSRRCRPPAALAVLGLGMGLGMNLRSTVPTEQLVWESGIPLTSENTRYNM